MTEAEFWSKLEEVGWLDAVPTAERTRLRAAVSDAFTGDPKYAFYALAVTSFDPECIEGSGPEDPCSYYSVLSQLAEASYGPFAPADLRDELDEDSGVARVSFKQGGQLFSCEVPWEDDWFQEPVLDLVNKAIKANKAKEQFIPLPPCDQTISLVLVPPAIYKKAVSAGIIPRKHLLDG
ncbi:MAG: hypothetical protein HYS12_18870 [Planctomycetes bacterium]|nr:hypothetical protein [Planctomycetota bacterium]